MSHKEQILEVGESDLQQFEKEIAASNLSSECKTMIQGLIGTHAWVHGQLEQSKLTIHQLRRLFGFQSESRKANSTVK